MKKIHGYVVFILSSCLMLGGVNAFAGQILEGDANVDQRNYPSTAPFIHPPFYNVKVKVDVGDDGVITAVTDNGTGSTGSVQEGNEEFWEKKNKPFFDTAVDGGLFEKFTGKTLDEVKAMDMNSDADAVSGATMVSAAAQEAVVNALEGRAGKTFLEVEGSALTVEGIEGNTITLVSNLPDDFDLQLLDIRWSVYNEDIIPEDSYSCDIKDGKMIITFEDMSALKPGFYYINVLDAAGKYRSPSFEGGPGKAQAAYFVIDSSLTEEDISFDGTSVVLASGDVKDYLKNIEHVQILREGNEEATEQAPVGHHGTVADFIALDDNGVLNADGIVKARDGSESALFEDGAAYTVTVAAFGYPELIFDFSK
ncbi:MAG: FMN-binding protein [Butyrivibrio sp.]|nr:FMN-binding protein [Butyrivibrio sp.]